MKLLTIVQEKRLVELETTIEKTKSGFVECGKALIEIRDSRLYLKTHENFESYCRQKWGWVRSYANRLIQASSVAKCLNDKGGLETIVSNPTQAVELSKVPNEKRAKVLEIAAKSGSVTAKSIAAAAKTVIKDAEIVIRDDTGYIVPPRALPFWNRKAEVEELLGYISKARSALRKCLPGLDGKNDPMFVETNLQAVVSDLNSAYTGLEVSRPYAVCPSCQGQSIKSCTLCKGRGVVSRFRFRTVPEELIAIRAKSCKK